MQLSERGNEAKTPNKAVKTDGAAPRPLPLPPRNSYAMISAFVRCLSLGATQSARLADLDTYRAVSVPQMPHLWNNHRRTRQVTRSAGHGTLGWRKSTSERANGAFEAAKMISHRRFITTASPLPERSCLPVCVASGRPSKTAVAAWEMECAMLDHGEREGCFLIRNNRQCVRCPGGRQ